MCSYVPPFVFWWVVTYLDITNFLYCLKYSGRRTMNDQQPYLNGMIPQQRMVESGLQGAHHTIYEIPISTLRSQTNQIIYWSFCWIFNVSKAERNSKILIQNRHNAAIPDQQCGLIGEPYYLQTPRGDQIGRLTRLNPLICRNKYFNETECKHMYVYFHV